MTLHATILELAARLTAETYETASVSELLDTANDWDAIVAAARQLGYREGHNQRTMQIVRELLKAVDDEG